MWPDRVSNPGPLTYESGALPIALHGPAYKGLKGAASLPTNDLVPPIRHTRNHPFPWHSKSQWLGLIYTSPVSSPPPQTIRDWNSLTDSLISASECTVDSDTKFTSLVMSRD